MSSFVLKIIAVVAMFCDHFGLYLTGGFSFAWNYVGRLAFPIFAYQISEGYCHTRNLKKYFTKLFVFAIISQIPFNLFEYALGFNYHLNIMFTLLLGLTAITIFDKSPNKLLGFAGVAICVALGHFLQVDYGYWGVLLVFCFYLFKDNKIMTSIVFLLLVLAKYCNNLIDSNFYEPYTLLAVSTFTAIIPILLYNKKQGPKTKYFLYIFYPVHLAILALAYLL